VLIIAVAVAGLLLVFSFFSGSEISVGNLVLRAQNGTTYPLEPPAERALQVRSTAPPDLPADEPLPRNVILVIGDGMGLGHVSAASALLEGTGGSLAMTRTEHVGFLRTWARNTISTDSAASATALATGFKTDKKYVGMLPDGRVPRNLFEASRNRGLATGVLTTSGLVDATSACFTSHVDSREKYDEIFEQMLQSDTDVLIGGDWTLYDKAKRNTRYMDMVGRAEMLAAEHGYQFSREESEVMSLPTPLMALYRPRDRFDEQHGPALETSVGRAIDLLERNPKGYLLVVESELTDQLAHENDIQSTMEGMRELDEAVAAILTRVSDTADTLVVVTADHDTGTLALVEGFYEHGEAEIRWASGDHSSQWVPIFAFGPGAEHFEGVLENTEIAQRIAWVLNLDGIPSLAQSQLD
jgi:alkaline phosphatase